MSIRIIGGTWRGRRLHAPSGLATRPIQDRIKQSLFDALGQTMEGWSVADVCAGSGSFGLEAASRGAAAVHLIESGDEAAEVIRGNLKILGNPPEVTLHHAGYEAVLPTLNELDLVFADPPFPWFRDDPTKVSQILTLATKTLAPTGRVVIRGERGSKLPSTGHGLHMQDFREYGRSWVATLELRKED